MTAAQAQIYELFKALPIEDSSRTNGSCCPGFPKLRKERIQSTILARKTQRRLKKESRKPSAVKSSTRTNSSTASPKSSAFRGRDFDNVRGCVGSYEMILWQGRPNLVQTVERTLRSLIEAPELKEVTESEYFAPQVR